MLHILNTPNNKVHSANCDACDDLGHLSIQEKQEMMARFPSSWSAHRS